MTPKEAQETATHNAITSVTSRLINFEIRQARKLSFEVLQDVNDHDTARTVANVLGLKLKPHEIE